MGIAGTNLYAKNIRLRFLSYIFLGVVALGSLLYWKSQLFLTTEYVDLQPTKHTLRNHPGLMQSKNYQLEEVEISPSAR